MELTPEQSVEAKKYPVRMEELSHEDQVIVEMLRDKLRQQWAQSAASPAQKE